MAIKILKHGKKEILNPTRRFVCSKCKCEFTAQSSDALMVGDVDRERIIYCPESFCSHMMSWDAHADKTVDPY